MHVLSGQQARTGSVLPATRRLAPCTTARSVRRVCQAVSRMRGSSAGAGPPRGPHPPKASGGDDGGGGKFRGFDIPWGVVVVCLVVAGSAVAISWSAKDGLVTAGGDIEQGLVKGGWQIRQGLVEGAKVHGSLLQRGAKEHGTLLQQAILGSGAMIALALWWPRGGGSGGGVGSGAGRVQGGGSGSSI